MPISRNRGKRVYDTRRTVTWECYVLVLNGFHERVLRSSHYPLIGLTRNLIFAGKVPFPRVGHLYIVYLLKLWDKFIHGMKCQTVHK